MRFLTEWVFTILTACSVIALGENQDAGYHMGVISLMFAGLVVIYYMRPPETFATLLFYYSYMAICIPFYYSFTVKSLLTSYYIVVVMSAVYGFEMFSYFASFFFAGMVFNEKRHIGSSNSSLLFSPHSQSFDFAWMLVGIVGGASFGATVSGFRGALVGAVLGLGASYR